MAIKAGESEQLKVRGGKERHEEREVGKELEKQRKQTVCNL